jgi:archaellum component FlaC
MTPEEFRAIMKMLPFLEAIEPAMRHLLAEVERLKSEVDRLTKTYEPVDEPDELEKEIAAMSQDELSQAIKDISGKYPHWEEE